VTSASRPAGFSSAQFQDLQARFDVLSNTAILLENERNFYYLKLRQVEAAMQNTPANLLQENPQLHSMIQELLRILWSTEDDVQQLTQTVFVSPSAIDAGDLTLLLPNTEPAMAHHVDEPVSKSPLRVDRHLPTISDSTMPLMLSSNDTESLPVPPAVPVPASVATFSSSSTPASAASVTSRNSITSSVDLAADFVSSAVADPHEITLSLPSAISPSRPESALAEASLIAWSPLPSTEPLARTESSESADAGSIPVDPSAAHPRQDPQDINEDEAMQTF
jgi:hypothetical protein